MKLFTLFSFLWAVNACSSECILPVGSGFDVACATTPTTTTTTTTTTTSTTTTTTTTSTTTTTTLGPTNFPSIRTMLFNYQTYATALQAKITPWIAHNFDYVITGADTRGTNPNNVWTSYADSAFIYINQAYSTLKASATTHSFTYEDAMLHMNQDYQIVSGMGWSNLDQFDAFEKTQVNGALTYNGTSYVDVTAQIYSGSSNTTVADRLYLGYSEPFDRATFTMNTNGSKTVAWAYWNGSAWSALTLASDTTSGLTANGTIIFNTPSDWAIKSLNSGSHSKYWVQATISGAGTTPIITTAKGDNWKSTYLSNNCRGWSSTDSNRINQGTPLEYNPTPPATATARFRYQARTATNFAVNSTYGNPGNIQGGHLTWAYVLDDQASGANAGGVMLDDGQKTPTFTSPSFSMSQVDVPSGTWATNAQAVFSQVIADLHSSQPAGYTVGSNPSVQPYANLGQFATDEQTYFTDRNALAPFNYPGGSNPALSFDGFLTANNSGNTQGAMFAFNNQNQGLVLNDGSWTPYDQSNRGPIAALATYYMGSNLNTLFGYNTLGFIYLESDEFYQWTAGTTTTNGFISSDLSSGTKTINVLDTTGCNTLNINGSVVFRLGGNGEVFTGSKVNGTTLTTTNKIRFGYSSGSALSCAIQDHQSCPGYPATCGSLPSLANVWKWGPFFPAIATDIGIPDSSGHNGGARDTSYISAASASGNSGACGSKCCPVWRRDFTKAQILVRPLTYDTATSELTTYSNSIALGGTFHLLDAMGNKGSGITSIALRCGESAILMK